ncbi:MAG: electron transport complex subunit RsxE [Pseudomonadota bacterium]
MTVARDPSLLATLRQAAWTENPAWVQLLGLCPLLAVSNSLTNAVGLSTASALVLLGSSITVSALRGQIPNYARLPLYLLIIASFTTCANLLLEAYAFPLYQRIALFLQIIVTNCMILGRLERVAGQARVLRAAADALGTAFGFAVALVVLGGVRELIATGRLGARLDELLGTGLPSAGWAVLPPDWTLPVAALPPGAFLCAGLALAAFRALFADAGNAQSPETQPAVPASDQPTQDDGEHGA